KPLEKAVAEKQFREDLFYRLNVVRVQMPALRERKDDIRLLVNYFLRKFAQVQKQQPKSISQSALEALERYHWPGNVRELENVVQRAIVVAKGDAILENDLPVEISRSASTVVSSTATASAPPALAAGGELSEIPAIAKALFTWARQDSKRKIIPTVERELIIAALAETGGNQVQASKLLGITRATLRKRVEKFGIKQELSIS
ncbi:MAG TPA: helix-turn-helix domain-containing protein, partial [Verrucomicrobiae bacterium]|nr:helix-turn-helix domain-containing protein [Verrucomicrobiae bacterium]